MKTVEHVTEWLGAYLDGELRGPRLDKVESHLAGCAACRSELEGLRKLSVLLQGTPPAGEFTPTERFVSALTLRLPRRAQSASPRKSPSPAWWLAPVGLIGLWFFVQTLITLSSGIAILAQSGWLEKGTAWITTAGQEHTEWYLTAMQLSGGRMAASVQSTLALFDQASLFGGELLSQLFWQAVVALLYWIWLAAWWLRTRDRAQSAGVIRI